jgi:hypothetical protein
VGHVHGALGAMRLLFMVGRGLGRAGAGEELDSFLGAAEAAEAGRAEEYDGVLNFFVPEAGEGLDVLGEDA